MFETKSKFHTTKWYADRTHWTDLFRPVIYSGYVGDPQHIPFYFGVTVGHSAYTDLKQDMKDIAALMKSNTRNECRRAEREGCVFELVSDMSEYVEFHNRFCISKGLDAIIDEDKLGKYKKILMAKTRLAEVSLAMHVTLLDEDSQRAVLLYSSSCRLEDGIDRKMIGWGNRYLHYKELELLKNMGYETYDWGGICTDTSDPRYSIGEFKLSFGGKVFENRTLRSPLYSFLEKARSVVRKICGR